jgi:hypothetical protein
MFKATMRRAALMVALPALIAGAAATPALADDGNDYKDDDYVVHVKVCKEVKYDYYKDKNKGKNEKFKMYLATYDKYYKYVDSDSVKVKADRCAYADLEYDPYYKKVTLKEYDIPYGYKFDSVKCYTEDDYGDYVYSDYKSVDKYKKTATCSFDNDYLKFVVVNKKENKYKDKY